VVKPDDCCGICTTTVPSCPDVGIATVAVDVAEPEYNENTVVNRPALELLPLGIGVTLLKGTCTSTVPSCPRAGRARVVVMGTDPENSDVTVVYDPEAEALELL
jgi:hypothetical protein